MRWCHCGPAKATRTTTKCLLIFIYFLLPFGCPMFGYAQQKRRTFRVHFFRKPDGPWLSLLNFRVVQQQSRDQIDVQEERDRETISEDYDDTEGWTVIEFDKKKMDALREEDEWKNGRKEGEMEKKNERDGEGKRDRGKDDGRDDEGKRDKGDEDDDEEENGRDREGKRNKGGEDDQQKEENAKTGKDEDGGVLINDQRPDVALFKHLILPWVPHRLRHHRLRPNSNKSHPDRSNETALFETTQKQNANDSAKGTPPTATTTTAATDVKLHLEDILVFGGFVTPSTTNELEENENGAEIGTNGAAAAIDNNGTLLAVYQNELANGSQQNFLNDQNVTVQQTNGSTTVPTTTDTMLTTTTTILAPINEEELAMNLHADPLKRDRQQLLMRLMIRSNDMSNSSTSGNNAFGAVDAEDEMRDAYRDLGGSFILPLLKERKYDNKSLPLVFPDVPLQVALSLEVLHLGNFDNFQMEYEMDVLVRLRWIDVRLANNFSKPIRIREQKIIDRIWRPDAVFLNSKFSYFHMVTFPNFRMRIMPDGHVSFTSRITLLPDCQMNFCNFPHDTQRCGLYISSIAHPKSMLDFHWEPRPILFPQKLALPDLRIKSISDTNCQLPGKLIPSSCLALMFVLKRDSARYVAERYMPSILAMLFSWVAPYVPYNYEEVRIITPITVLLTLVQMEKGSQEVITSYLTSLDIWFVVIKAFTVLSLLESLAVMAYIKKGRAVESEAQRAPNAYRRELLQAEVKRIERLYHRLDHLSMALSPLAFLLFLLYYVQFVAQRDGRSCVEQRNVE